MTIYADSFQRPDANTLGNINGVPWTYSQYGWGIRSNTARSLGGTVVGYDAWAVFNSESRDLDMQVQVSSEGGDALIFRHNGSNSFHRAWLNSWNNNGVRVWRLVYEIFTNGNRSIIHNTEIPSNTQYLRARVVGTSVQLFTRSSPLNNWAERYSGTQTAHVNNTRHGIGRAKERTFSGTNFRFFSLDTLNNRPNPPTNLQPPDGAQLNRAIDNVFSATFNDPDPGDSRSFFDIEFWRSGQNPQTVRRQTSSGIYNFIAGQALGQMFWRWRDADSQGLLGDYSPTRSVTWIEPPAGPTLLTPTAGSTISVARPVSTWLAPNQDRYRYRVYGDSAGSVNTGLVLVDDLVTSITTRSHSPSSDIPDGIFVWISIQVEHNGLWGPETMRRYPVSYTRPAVPSVHVEPAGNVIIVSSSRPAPTGGQPTVISYNVWRKKLGDPDEFGKRIATGIGPNASFIDRRVEHLESYLYAVEDLGNNTTTRRSLFSD